MEVLHERERKEKKRNILVYTEYVKYPEKLQGVIGQNKIWDKS